MHTLLSAGGGGPADGVLRNVRRQAAVSRVFLYDADKVTAAASTPDEKDLYQAQLDLLLDPADPEVITAARAAGISDDWLEAARRSPVYALAKKYKVALPLHPEYRTMPMVWYILPLSPIVDLLAGQGHDAESHQPLRRHRGVADPGGIPGRTVHRGDAAAVDGGAAQACRDALVHARCDLGRETRPEIPASVGDDRGTGVRDVPPPGDRQIP